MIMNIDRKKKWLLPVLGGMGLMASAATSQAALVLEFNEVGSNVVLSFSGSVSLSSGFVGQYTSSISYQSTLRGNGLCLV